MQHLFNFAIELEDDRIVERVSDNAEKQIIKEIADQVKANLFHQRHDYRTCSVEYDGQLTEFAQDIMLGWLTDHKEEIIEKTAEVLAKRLSTSKAAKNLKEGIEC